MRTELLLCFCFSCIICVAQSQYRFPQEFPRFYDQKPMELDQKLRANPPKGYTKDDLENFSVKFLYNEQYLFDNNLVYLDWLDVENYLNRLLDTILYYVPNPVPSRVFITRSGYEETCASRLGNIFLSVSALRQTKSESELVALLTHHYGHLYYKHGWALLGSNPNEFSSSFIRYSAGQADYNRDEFFIDSMTVAMLCKLNLNLEAMAQEWHTQKQSVFPYYVKDPKFNSGPMFERWDSLDRVNYKKENYTKAELRKFAHYQNVFENFKKCGNSNKNFLMDSVFYIRLAKIAKEEQKKILFERANWYQLAMLSFVDFIKQPKDKKNLYYLIESTRRAIFIDPEKKKKGFLTENYEDRKFYLQHHSILEDSSFVWYYFYDSIPRTANYFGNVKKPFKTYEEAFMHFTQIGLSGGFNEANFSRALYYMDSNQDSVISYLEKYLKNGSSANYELANKLVKREKLLNSDGKMLYLYSNFICHTNYEFNYKISFNKMRFDVNSGIKIDSNSMYNVNVGNLMGAKPNQLNQYQKIIYLTNTLFSERELEIYRKVRKSSGYLDEKQLSDYRHYKNLLFYAPETYSWFVERNISSLFFVEFEHKFPDYNSKIEVSNKYIGYYFDLNQTKPVIKKSSRTGLVLKQEEPIMFKDLNSFLYD